MEGRHYGLQDVGPHQMGQDCDSVFPMSDGVEHPGLTGYSPQVRREIDPIPVDKVLGYPEPFATFWNCDIAPGPLPGGEHQFDPGARPVGPPDLLPTDAVGGGFNYEHVRIGFPGNRRHPPEPSVRSGYGVSLDDPVGDAFATLKVPVAPIGTRPLKGQRWFGVRTGWRDPNTEIVKRERSNRNR